MAEGADYSVKIQAQLLDFEKAESKLRSLEKNPINIKVQLTGLDGSDLNSITKKIQATAIKASTAFNDNFKIDFTKATANINEFAKQQANLVQKQRAVAKQMQPVIAQALAGFSGKEIDKASNQSAQKFVNQQEKVIKQIRSLLDSNSVDAKLSSFDKSIENFHIDTTEYKNAASSIQQVKEAYDNLKSSFDRYSKEATLSNYDNACTDFSKLNSALDQAQKKIKILTTSQSNLEKEAQQAAQAAQKIIDNINSKAIDSKLSSFTTNLGKYNSDSDSYQRASQSLQALQNAYQEAKAAKNAFEDNASNANAQNLIQSYERVQNALKQAQNEMRILSNEQSKLISSSTKASMIKNFETYFNENSKAAKKYADDISILRQQLESLATTADKVDFDTKFNNLKATINRNGDTGKSAWDELKRGFGQIAEFTGVYGVTSRIQDALMSMPSVVVEVDNAMTDLQMATGATDEQAQQLMSTYSEMGKVLKATATDISASATEWMKQGQSIADSQTLAEYSIILSKIGDLSSTDATKTITAAMKSYDLNIDEVMGFIDQISSIDIASATDVGGLSQAFNEVAANARQAGVETQQLLAYAAAIGETTQEGMASVGTSLNSIFSRMGNIKLARLKDYENNGEDLNIWGVTA